MARKPRTTDTISFRCPPDLEKALNAFLDAEPSATQSGVVVEALRRYLGAPEPGTIARGEWQGMVEHVSYLADRLDESDALVAQLERRLAALEVCGTSTPVELEPAEDGPPPAAEPHEKPRPANW